MVANVRPAVNMVLASPIPQPSPLTNIASPNSPKTMDGTPARLVMSICTPERNRPIHPDFGAYSSNQIAAPIETGMVNSIA